jgi:hypothetical protein
VTNTIPLTIVNNIDGGPRIENGESAGLIEAGGVCGTVFDLEAETENMSAHVCRVDRRVIYLGTVERRVRASSIGDVEAVLGERVQDSAGVVKEPEGLATGVGDDHGDCQMLQSIDLGVRGRGPDGQAGGSRDGDGGGGEGDEGSTEGIVRGEHCDEGGEGG